MIRHLGALGALALVLVAAGPLAAQDDERDWPDPKDPLIPDVQKPGAKTTPPSPEKKPGTDEKPADEKPADEKPPEDKTTSSDEEKTKVHPRFIWTHWDLEVTDLHIGAARGPSSGRSTTIGLAAPERSQSDGFEHQTSIGEWLRLDMAFRYVTARGGELAPREFDLKGRIFARDEVLDTKFEFITTDLALAVKPLHGELGHLDVIGGLRYVGTWTRVQDAGGGKSAAQSVEALFPTLGVGGSLRLATEKDILVFEPFARGMVGGLAFGGYRAFMLSVEAGARILIADIVGVELGYRYELGDLDRGSGGETRTAHWRAGGMIAGVVLNF